MPKIVTGILIVGERLRPLLHWWLGCEPSQGRDNPFQPVEKRLLCRDFRKIRIIYRNWRLGITMDYILPERESPSCNPFFHNTFNLLPCLALICSFGCGSSDSMSYSSRLMQQFRDRLKQRTTATLKRSPACTSPFSLIPNNPWRRWLSGFKWNIYSICVLYFRH